MVMRLNKLSLTAFLVLLSAAPTALAQTVVIEQSACRYLTEYQPDGNVEYQPGVDVDGDPVVPADINRHRIVPPDAVSFEITVDVARYAGISVPPGTEGYARIGTVTIENNRLKFNGEPLKPESEEALIALCDKDIDNDSGAATAAEAE